MHTTFWQGVVSPELGLFEKKAYHEVVPAFLPKPGACLHDLEMVGLMLCKSLIDEHPTGLGLGRFVFDFLLERNEESRAFAVTDKPVLEQAETAIRSLSLFDDHMASMYRGYLFDESGALSTSERVGTTFGEAPVGERLKLNENHELFNEPVTVDNLPPAIVASCKFILRQSRQSLPKERSTAQSPMTPRSKRPDATVSP